MVTSISTSRGSRVQHEEGALARRAGASKEPSLYFYSTFPPAPVRAMVGVLHGYADYGARYVHVMDAWAERGVASVAIDLRGHGRAKGERGFCRGFEEYIDDASELRRLLVERAPGVPAFLFGHSFGGLVATSYVLADPWSWRGLVLSSPYFASAIKVPTLKLAVGKLASRVWPSLSLPSGLQGADVTRDPVRARAYDHDPLVFQKANARWFTEVQRAQASALERAPQLGLPLCIVAAGQDRLADITGTRALFLAAASGDKTLDVREAAFHEVLSDPDWRAAADTFADWIVSRAG
jgi:alpha-beta hydrolase superfamily lysophospholipase